MRSRVCKACENECISHDIYTAQDTCDCAHATQTPPKDLRELRVAAYDIYLRTVSPDLSLLLLCPARTEQNDSLGAYVRAVTRQYHKVRH
jgi:hypothetical protein